MQVEVRADDGGRTWGRVDGKPPRKLLYFILCIRKGKSFRISVLSSLFYHL